MAKSPELEPLFLLSDEPIDAHGANAFTDDPFAKTVARAALGTTGPFTIGVYGGWGSGKTSALHAARTMIDDTPAWAHVVTVEFNAWRFEREAHPIVPLVATIEQAVAKKAAHLAGLDAAGHRDQISWYQKASMHCRAFLAGWQFKLKPEIGIPLVGKVSAEAIWSAKDSLQRFADLSKELKALDGEHWSALRDSCLSLSVFDALDRVGEAVGLAAGNTKANWPLVIVFIDDLDRCQADKAFELLESVKLVLCQPGFVFVLALNHAVVDGYLTHRAEKLYGKDNINLHRSYLEKIVQLPLAMPSRSDRFAGFAKHLIEQRLSKAADPMLRKGLQEMAALLALAADDTPRTLVRAINGVLLDIALRDPSELKGPLKDERQPYPKYAALCVVQRALERSIGPELTKELARQDVLCAAILKDPVWGADDAVRNAGGRGDGDRAEPSDSIAITPGPQAKAPAPRLRPEEIARWRAVVDAILERPFLWKDQEDDTGKPIPGSALFTSKAGKDWLANRQQRLAVMKAAVAAPLTAESKSESQSPSATPIPDDSPGRADPSSGVEAWMRGLDTLAKAEANSILLAARRALGRSPSDAIDAVAWGKVKSMNLTGDPVTDAGAAWLARPDTGLKALTTLDLGGTDVTDIGVQHLARPDTGLKALTFLSLVGTKVRDGGVQHLARPDTGLEALTSLSLPGTKVTDAGVQHLARPDTGLKALTSLNLWSTATTEDSLIALASPNTGLQKLQHLAPSKGQVTRRSLSALAATNTGLSALRSLDLSSTDVTDASLRHLARPDTGLDALTFLSLVGTQVTDKGVNAVKARWPFIEIVR